MKYLTKITLGFILILLGVLNVSIFESLWFLIMVIVGMGFEISGMNDRKIKLKNVKEKKGETK